MLNAVNPLELGALGAVLCIFYFLSKKAGYSFIQSLYMALFLAPFLFFTIHDLTNILTYDETYIVFEPVDILYNNLTGWKLGAFRTTDIIIGIPMAVVSAVTGFTKDILVTFAKLLHWFISLFLIWLCVESLLRYHCIKKSYSTALFLFCSVILYPVCLLGLKVFNYDSFSLLFGTLAILLMLEGLTYDRRKITISIVLMALASQEKLIASPLLWVIIVAAGIHAAMAQKNTREAVFASFRVSVMGSLYSSGVFVLSFFLLLAIRGGRMPSYNPLNILRPLLGALWPVMRHLVALLAPETSSWRELLTLPIFAAAFAIISGLLAVCLSLLLRKLKTTFPSLRSKFQNRLLQISDVFLIVTVIIGIASAFMVKAYLYPYAPVMSGRFVPTMIFNKSAIHFNAISLIGHLSNFIGWAYAQFFTAIPTVWLAIALVLALRNIFSKKVTYNSWLQSCVLIALLLVPALYGLFQIPVSARYMNLFLLLFVFITASNLLIQIRALSIVYRSIFFALILLASFIEMHPFRPLGASFRPWWLSYSKEYMTQPSKGILNPWWMGWGEEVSIAGKRIVGKYKQSGNDCSDVKLYSNYTGGWLRSDACLSIIMMDTCSVFTYGDDDYYLFNRMGVTQSSFPFPYTVKPCNTIEFRGFVQAWIFRGSDITGLFDGVVVLHETIK